MRGRSPWIALAAGAYVAFLLSLFPAATAVRWLAPESLRVAGVSGTIWSGSAALASLQDLGIRDVRWRLRRLPVLLGRLSGALDARLPNGFLETAITATPFRVSLSNARLSTDVGTLAGALPVSGASGLISATLDTLVLRDGWPVELRGQVRVSDLLVEPYFGGQGLLALGSHEIRFEPSAPGTLQGVIRDLGGPLEVNGTLRVSAARDYVLEGQLVLRPEASPMLVQGVGLMTSDPDPAGRRSFMFTGSL